MARRRLSPFPGPDVPRAEHSPEAPVLETKALTPGFSAGRSFSPSAPIARVAAEAASAPDQSRRTPSHSTVAQAT